MQVIESIGNFTFFEQKIEFFPNAIITPLSLNHKASIMGGCVYDQNGQIVQSSLRNPVNVVLRNPLKFHKESLIWHGATIFQLSATVFMI